MNPRVKLREQYLPFGQPNFSEEEMAAVMRVLRSRWIGMGPETERFESELAQFVAAKHVVTVNSCTSALFLSLLVHGIGPGDEVIVPSLTWCSTANAALYLGATPVFCDVDRSTFCVTPDAIAERLTPRTRAVIVVHLGGLAIDVDAVRAVLPQSVALVEDAAHALGGSFADGRPVGSSGNLTCFSFYANKNLSTGEGGAVALADEAMANRLRSLRQHGLNADAWKRFSDPRAALTPDFEEVGYKMNYTDLQASIGRVQLRRQPEFHAIRLAAAQNYVRRVGELRSDVKFQVGVLDQRHSRHLILVTLPLENMKLSRGDVVLEMRNRKIGASIHYRPLHTIPLYSERFPASLPSTEWIAERVMTLPISANMTDDDVLYVAEHFLGIVG
jgi:perosamine synthetase